MYILLMEYLLRMQQKYGLLRVVNVYCAIIILRDIMDDGVFRIISLDLLRGRTFTNAYYIVDEAQNIRPEEIKTLLT